MIDMVMYGLMILIVICIILIWYVNVYNKFQEYIIRINEVESNIDTILRKRFDLLNKSIGIIKSSNEELNDKDVLKEINELRSKKLSNFELDRLLYESINEFHLYKDTIPELKNNESFMKIDLGINESEIEITALRKYYNDIITEYNKSVKVFPNMIVSKICHYKNKPYFDGKDMTDNIVNDFKL